MDDTLADPLTGRLLDGRYAVTARIAHGGMATVYLAMDTRLDREVALKVMHAELARDDDFVRRFIGEAKSVARLSHQNVVAVFDQGADGLTLNVKLPDGFSIRLLGYQSSNIADRSDRVFVVALFDAEIPANLEVCLVLLKDLQILHDHNNGFRRAGHHLPDSTRRHN